MIKYTITRRRCTGTHVHTHLKYLVGSFYRSIRTYVYFIMWFINHLILINILTAIFTVITFIAKRQNFWVYLSWLISAWDTLGFVLFFFYPPTTLGGARGYHGNMMSTSWVNLVEPYEYILWSQFYSPTDRVTFYGFRQLRYSPMSDSWY